ncbi:hypothetical protein DL96DRAFT_1212627 [Flagelloscypha sp. PMI_526]|nr:hypothetical protein DL96DRAFT_1212627 [Flagelloscypha sp. PMI_526]
MYEDLGRYTEALDLLFSVLAHRQHILGDEHPDTLDSITNLASMYNKLERHTEAVDLLIPALGIAVRVLGSDHRITLTLKHLLGKSPTGFEFGDVATLSGSDGEELGRIANAVVQYTLEERWDDAIELGEIAVEAFSGIMGEFHPVTVVHILGHAMNCLNHDRVDDGRRYIERGYRVVRNSSFPSEGNTRLVQTFEQLYSLVCLETSLEAHPSMENPQANIVQATAESKLSDNLMPPGEDDWSPRVKAPDAAKASRNALESQSKDRKGQAKDDTAACDSTHATQTENSQNVSTVSVANTATISRTGQISESSPETSRGMTRKGKTRDHSSIPNGQKEGTARFVINIPVDKPSVGQDRAKVLSSLSVRSFLPFFLLHANGFTGDQEGRCGERSSCVHDESG